MTSPRTQRTFCAILGFSLVISSGHAQCSSNGSWSFAAAGDLIGEFVDTNNSLTHSALDIVNGADFAFFNMEGQTFGSNFTGWPASENGADSTYGGIGGGAWYDPIDVFRLAQNGFVLASRANNHAWDYAVAGSEATESYLAEAGIASAGTGSSLQESREAGVQIRCGKRIALVAASGSHQPHEVAGPGGDNGRGRTESPRPGVNVLRATAVTRVNSTKFEIIKDIARNQGQLDLDSVTDITLYTGQQPYGWSNWRLAEEEGIDWDINEDDYTGILDSIQAAKNSSDATIFSLHAHESDSGADDSYNPMPLPATTPASYTRNISRAAIDAGADVVAITGPHHLRGIEIYEGRPIFYSLSSLTYSLGLNFRGFSLPIEWDDSVIALTKFDGATLQEVALYPTVHSQLTNDTTLPDSQMPKLAPSNQAQRILQHLQKVSEPFGTHINITGDVGYVVLPQST